jgi:hypothetical protein
MAEMNPNYTFDPQRAANAVPERHRLERSLTFGACKRCLGTDAKPGDIIVRVYGQGWWHDRCYRVVNPKFYDGLAEPTALATEPVPF